MEIRVPQCYLDDVVHLFFIYYLKMLTSVTLLYIDKFSSWQNTSFLTWPLAFSSCDQSSHFILTFSPYLSSGIRIVSSPYLIFFPFYFTVVTYAWGLTKKIFKVNSRNYGNVYKIHSYNSAFLILFKPPSLYMSLFPTSSTQKRKKNGNWWFWYSHQSMRGEMIRNLNSNNKSTVINYISIRYIEKTPPTDSLAQTIVSEQVILVYI